jgi:hypothetical protein
MKSLAAYRIHADSETGRIGDIKLVERLSKDYIFQIHQWKNSDFILGEEYKYFVDNAFKFTNRLFGYGIKYKNINVIRKAIIASDELNKEGLTNPRRSIHFLLKFARVILGRSGQNSKKE